MRACLPLSWFYAGGAVSAIERRTLCAQTARGLRCLCSAPTHARFSLMAPSIIACALVVSYAMNCLVQHLCPHWRPCAFAYALPRACQNAPSPIMLQVAVRGLLNWHSESQFMVRCRSIGRTREDFSHLGSRHIVVVGAAFAVFPCSANLFSLLAYELSDEPL